MNATAIGSEAWKAEHQRNIDRMERLNHYCDASFKDDCERWTRPIVVEPHNWRAFLCWAMQSRRLNALSVECGYGLYPLARFARGLALDYLRGTGLGVAAALQGDDELNYWRCVAIFNNPASHKRGRNDEA